MEIATPEYNSSAGLDVRRPPDLLDVIAVEGGQTLKGSVSRAPWIAASFAALLIPITANSIAIRSDAVARSERPEVSPIGQFVGAASFPFLGNFWVSANFNLVVKPLQVIESIPEAVLSARISVEVSPEAAKRIQTHEPVVKSVVAIAEEEAQDRNLNVLYIKIRPAWSHEYEEHTGVVVEVKIRASTEERFSYWEAVSDQLNQLASGSPSQELRFLNEDLSFIVRRS
jgi:hypothetical protein